MGIELKLKSVIKAVDEQIPSLEKLIGKKINEHLGFSGKLTCFGEVKVKFNDRMNKLGWLEGTKYIGEWCPLTNQPHGRGILILKDESIEIGLYNNGHHATGNFIYFRDDKDVQVGERYIKNTVRWLRGVYYNLKEN